MLGYRQTAVQAMLPVRTLGESLEREVDAIAQRIPARRGSFPTRLVARCRLGGGDGDSNPGEQHAGRGDQRQDDDSGHLNLEPPR